MHWRNWEASPYADTVAVSDALDYIHISKAREALPSLTWLPDAMAELAAGGIQFTLTAWGDYFPVADQVAMLRSFAASHPGAIHAVEGPNEPYNWPLHYAGLTGQAAGLAFQTDLYRDIRQAPELNGARVYDVSDLGFTGPADAANFHAYNLAGGPAAPAIAAALLPITGGSTQNVVLTELGWGTGADLLARNVLSGQPAPWESVDERTQAQEIVKGLSSAFSMGIAETYLYELVDPFPRLTGSDLVYNFGLFHDDWTPKASARALHAFGTILSDPTTGLSANAMPAAQMTLRPADLHVLTLAHHANRTDYIVWDEHNNWDGRNDTAFAAHLAPLTMNFDRPVADILVFDPMAGSDPVARLGHRADLSLWVGADPLIVSVFQAPSALVVPVAQHAARIAPRTVTLDLFRKDVLAMDLSPPMLGNTADAHFGVSGTLLTDRGEITVSAAARIALRDGVLSFDPADPAVRINALHHELFGRAPEPFARAWWSEVWQTQGGFAAVLDGMLGSEAFLARAATDTRQFAAELYRDILQREPDQAGWDAAVAALEHGASRAGMARGAYASAEYNSHDHFTGLGLWSADPTASRVARLYLAVLDRAPDQDGLNFWLDAAQQGFGFDQLAASFIHSPEAGGRFTARADPDYVASLYQDVLGRAPDADGFAFWTGALVSHAISREWVMLGFADSLEFQRNTAAQTADGLVFV